MAYFSNGTEGMMWEEQNCARCVLFDLLDEDEMCPILNTHYAHNYDQLTDGKPNVVADVLGLLIARGEDGSAGKCALKEVLDKRVAPLIERPVLRGSCLLPGFEYVGRPKPKARPLCHGSGAGAERPGCLCCGWWPCSQGQEQAALEQAEREEWARSLDSQALADYERAVEEEGRA